jgi:hypothetical protein
MGVECWQQASYIELYEKACGGFGLGLFVVWSGSHTFAREDRKCKNPGLDFKNSKSKFLSFLVSLTHTLPYQPRPGSHDDDGGGVGWRPCSPGSPRQDDGVCDAMAA